MLLVALPIISSSVHPPSGSAKAEVKERPSTERPEHERVRSEGADVFEFGTRFRKVWKDATRGAPGLTTMSNVRY